MSEAAPPWRTTCCSLAAVRPGLRAAIAIAETESAVSSVAVVSKVYPMRSHTVSAEGGAAGRDRRRTTASTSTPTTPSPAATGSATRTPSRRSSREAPRRAAAARALGLPVEPAARRARIAVRPFGGMKKMRTWFAADKTGFHMLHTLFQTSLKYDRRHAVRRVVRHAAAGRRRPRARRRGDRADDRAGSRRSPPRRSCSCTGGCGKVFPFTTNANI